MNDLFRNFKRAIRDAIDGEFRSGKLGQLASRLKGPRAQSRAAMRSLMRRSRTAVDRYALPSFRALRDQMLRAVTAALKPIVNLMRGLVGGFQGSGETPIQTATGAGGGIPPRVPPVATGGISSGGGFDDEIRAAINLLTGQGYTVTPPGGKPPSLKDLGFRRPDIEHEPGPAPFPLGPARERVQIPGGTRRHDPNDPVFSGEMVEVESSNVHSIGYIFNANDPAKGTLKVRFLQDSGKGKKSGPGPLYHYNDVHPNVFDAFLRAASMGGFVWDRLRIRGTVSGHRYHYELKGIVNSYLPRKATRYGQKEYFIQRQTKFRSARTGNVREFTSSLPDQFVQNLSQPRRGPEAFVPRNGRPRGPNRGRP